MTPWENVMNGKPELGKLHRAVPASGYVSTTRIRCAGHDEPHRAWPKIATDFLFLVLFSCGAGMVVAAYSPGAHAGHLKNASKAKLEEMLALRLDYPARLNQVGIPPSSTPRELPRAIEELPSWLRKRLERKSVLSFYYYDGRSIKYDWRRPDIGEDLPIYGMSMSKSITSYLLGRAFCDGRIDSLDDPMEKYVPALEDTFYGQVSIRNALDMTSGDRKLYSKKSRKAGSDWKRYVIPVVQKGLTILEAMRALGMGQPSKNKFAYRNANTDAIAMVVSAVSPEGFGQFAAGVLADEAGFRYPSMFLADRDNALMAFAFFYATRSDWLRAAVRIGEEFRSEGCVGDYLRSAISESVPMGISDYDYRRYGKFFWVDSKFSKVKHVRMSGHGGQLAFIDIENGRVLVVHAIRHDYDGNRIFKSIIK